MSALRLRREFTIGALLLFFGIAVLPALIYLVGTVVIGPYEGDGIASLYAAILAGAGNLEPVPWLLILSPYLVVQLLRVMLALRRPRRAVKPVTK